MSLHSFPTAQQERGQDTESPSILLNAHDTPCRDVYLPASQTNMEPLKSLTDLPLLGPRHGHVAGSVPRVSNVNIFFFDLTAQALENDKIAMLGLSSWGCAQDHDRCLWPDLLAMACDCAGSRRLDRSHRHGRGKDEHSGILWHGGRGRTVDDAVGERHRACALESNHVLCKRNPKPHRAHPPRRAECASAPDKGAYLEGVGIASAAQVSTRRLGGCYLKAHPVFS